MTWTKTILIGAGLAVALGSYAWSSSMGDHGPRTVERWQGSAHLDWCDGAVARLEVLNAAGPYYLGLDDGQSAAWTTLMNDMRKALGGFEKTCMEGMGASKPDAAPVRLASLRDQLVTGIDAIDSIRPSFDAFYASLDNGQKQRVEDLLARGRHK